VLQLPSRNNSLFLVADRRLSFAALFRDNRCLTGW
jgi:hypothetical protein